MAKLVTKLMSFFDRRDKKKLFLLLFSFLLVGIIETFSVASIAPFVAVVSHPEIITTNSYLLSIYNFFSFSNDRQFILFLGGLVFFFLVFGNLFSAFMQWCLIRFSFSQCHKISTRLLKQYLLQPYSFYLLNNRSDITKNIISDVYKVVTGIFVSGMQAITKSIIVLCIFLLLLIVNWPLACLVGGVLGGAYAAFYLLLSKKLSMNGSLASTINGKQYQAINETLGAIKELKVLGREGAFLKRFKTISLQYVLAESSSAIAPQITRYIVEGIAFGGILLIVMYLTHANQDISKVLPLLALYALAGYRLLPPMQQIFVGLSLAKFHAQSLDNVYDVLQEKQGSLLWDMSEEEPLKFENEIRLENVTYQYPETENFALKNVNISIKKNTTIGLVGETGSGKTTLVDIILGLFRPSAGDVKVDQVKLDESTIAQWQKNVGYVPQTLFLIDDSIKNNIALGVEKDEIDENAIIEAAKIANIHNFIIHELPNGYDTKIGEGGIRLSGGQRQRLGIARALYHNPDVIVFDEATSALDAETEQVIIHSINALSQQKTIVIIAHRLSTVESCDQIYFFHKGKVLDQGRFSELIVRNKAFQKIAKHA